MTMPPRRPRILVLDPENPNEEVLAAAAEVLRADRLVVAPSDTVYGILGRRSEPALRRLGRIKGRPGPFLVLVPDLAGARSLAGKVAPGTWERILRVWPGPVTVVLPARLPDPVTLGTTLAIRLPDSDFLRGLCRRVGEPLVSTSANPPGVDPPLTAAAARGHLGTGIDLYLDAGRMAPGDPSTLVDLTTRPPRLLRKGRGDPRALLDPGPDAA
jgi:L-threonylcarbamoyladenylate synthase